MQAAVLLPSAIRFQHHNQAKRTWIDEYSISIWGTTFIEIQYSRCVLLWLVTNRSMSLKSWCSSKVSFSNPRIVFMRMNPTKWYAYWCPTTSQIVAIFWCNKKELQTRQNLWHDNLSEISKTNGTVPGPINERIKTFKKKWGLLIGLLYFWVRAQL